jgi:hypothetical protein
MKDWLLKLLIKYVVSYIPKGVTDMITKIRTFLDGKKMYLAALGLVIQAVIEYLGDNDLSKLITKLIAAFGVAATKAAIVKSGL